MNTTRAVVLSLALGLASGCLYNEPLDRVDLHGTISIPKSAARYVYYDDAFNEVDVEEDVRAIGPVYLGAFASVGTQDYGYPHPEMGPVIDANIAGNTYPYGGTSVGSLVPACLEQLACKVTGGRFESYDDLLDWFNNKIDRPVLNPWEEDSDGDGEVDVLTGGTSLQEVCFDHDYITSDDEVDFLRGGLDFKEDGDNFVADFTMPHVEFHKGMQVWGWVDMPVQPEFSFASCDPSTGYRYIRYSDDYYMGAHQSTTLNYPDDSIDNGDWIVDNAPVIDDPEKDIELNLGFEYTE